MTEFGAFKLHLILYDAQRIPLIPEAEEWRLNLATEGSFVNRLVATLRAQKEAP